MILTAIFLLFSFAAHLPIVLIGLMVGLSIFLVGKLLRDRRLVGLGWNILVAQDQAMNAATGGDPDETISSRTGKLRNSRPWAHALDAFLNLFEREHAAKAIEADEGEKRIVE